MVHRHFYKHRCSSPPCSFPSPLYSLVAAAMGIPSFYKWLVNRYPSILSPAKEEPADSSKESHDGDGIIYDNLYLDMNGIIHQCFHPQDQMHTHIHVPPTTLDEVFESMFEYMDNLFRIVRPRRLLYLAVDGVAPCAKMNQIRRGRFHSARQARYEEMEEDRLREELRAEGKEVPPREISEVSDPNVITPGTEFMEKLSQALEHYIRARLNSDPGWKDIMVILSDANVPGEGEHKIMSFIRAQRSMEGYDPNTRHCLYGHDADLIMLALASHEVHFSILREDVRLPNQAENNSRFTEANPKKPYLFLNIWVLREYLEIELKIQDPVCELDIERLIDDFIFICFLMGNDFVPHIPSLKMQEACFAVDLLIEVYKTTFNKMGGYIVDTDKVKYEHAAYLEVSRLEMFFHELSMYEEKIFLKRYELQQDSLQKLYRDLLREASESERLELRRKLQDVLFNEERPYDSIRLGLPGWKSRFYKEYFGVETSNEIGKLQNDMAQKYLEGLCWVLQCYFADVPSWSWYYPFYVAPFVSDLKGLSRFKISFTVDKPLRPFDQLMAVLPLRSQCALPECYRKLMVSKYSEIQTLYPKLETDMNGKRFLWNGISEELLLSATKTADEELATHEMRRNTTRQEKIFLQRGSSALPHNEIIMQSSYCSPIDSATRIGGWLSTDDDDGLRNGFFLSPQQNLQGITNDQAISATFFNPEAVNPIPGLLGNVRVPDKTVTAADISKRPLWHTYPGSRPPPPIVQRPDTIWKLSTPATPREEHKNAGTGWMGRGRVNAAETTQLTRSSSYGHGVGNGTAGAETQQSSSSSSSYSYRNGVHRVDMVQSRGSSSRFEKDGAYSFRPHGGAPWRGDGGCGGGRNGGAGHGGSAQPRGW
ncbi:5'-3' exoribonuclease 4-like isoform X2 [Phragmites australis]|uniref:5'-3' exoribonuclease 4-like isoform X2 n=1 Tax=Phragmites australis TaxID=29695 RepID=UPI002D78FE9F|nr:5'-3' exoribonuclease 4-like isoform X2 [Phragmites australis]